MKQLLLVICLSMSFFTFGCTLKVQTEENFDTADKEKVNQDVKVETAAEPINAGKEMSVHFIDVGQGDSILIQSPEGRNMLVDAGTREAGKRVVAYLREQGIEELDYVIATHPDADHIGGLIAVLDSISIKHFMDSGKVHTSKTYEEMLQLILDKKLSFIVPKKGDIIPLDSTIEITVLNGGEVLKDNNDASLVLRVEYKEISFLLTGDADVSVEQDMLNEYDLDSTILKAGHHGSDTSSSETFIRNVQPKVTVLSYGEDNSYGHPAIQVKSRLKEIGSEIYSTAEVGNIVVKTDGLEYRVSTHSKTIENEAELNKVTSSIVISSKDLRKEIVGITNKGKDLVNLEGWQLVSLEGNQVFTFPYLNLGAGKTIYITSGPDAKEGQGYLKWNNQQIWKNDGDKANLLSKKGDLVSELE